MLITTPLTHMLPPHTPSSLPHTLLPPSQVIVQALMSLPKVLMRRHLPAEQLRSQATLSVSKHPQLILQPTLSAELPCEFLSLETMHRWILSMSVM